jgi:PAS domain S-box-containing protein
MFFKRRRSKNAEKAERDLSQQMKIEESQRVLLLAATETANAAHAVTTTLKTRLEDSVKRFESTARILSDALLLCDPQGVIQACNPAAETIFGVPQAALIGSSAHDLFSREGKPLSPHDIWYLLEDAACWLPHVGDPVQGRRADGERFWIEPKLERLDWADRSYSMLLLVRDMTPSVALRSEADDAGQRYRSIFETSFDGILIEQGDIIVAANPSIQRLFGYHADELLDRPVAVLFAAEDHDTVERDASHCHLAVRGLAASGKSLNLMFTATQIVWNEKPARLITMKDVTDMRRLEEIAAHKRDNGVDMVCCYDTKFRITFANQSFARFHNRSRAELLNKDIRTLLPSEHLAAFLANIAKLDEKQHSCRMQVQITEDGPTRVQDWIDHAVFDAEGNAVEYQRVGRDISEVVAGLITS